MDVRHRDGRSAQITLFLAGDVMTGRGVDQILPSPSPPRLYERLVTSALEYVELSEVANGPIPTPVDYAYVWGVLLELLDRERPDVWIINLETSVTTSEDAEPKGINYRMHPGNVGVLTAARIDCCELANNHVLDWGVAGLRETLQTLDESGIRVAGAGRNLAAASAPAVLDLGDESRVLVFACAATDAGIPRRWSAGANTPGVHLLPDFSDETVDAIARSVTEVRQPGDIIVVALHWGPNWGFAIPGAHRRFAHALIERAGVDVIHGHSSHHPMGIEVYRGRPIFYGCGDFLNDYEGIRGYEEYRGDLVVAYLATLDARSGDLARLMMTPLQIRNFRLNYPTALDRAWMRETLDRECRRFGNRVTLCADALTLTWM